MAGELLIAVQENGELAMAMVTRDNLRVLSRNKLLNGRCWTGPVVAGGRLFVRDAGQLIALQLPP